MKFSGPQEHLMRTLSHRKEQAIVNDPSSEDCWASEAPNAAAELDAAAAEARQAAAAATC
jgi:hypothetical protein